MAAYTTRLRPDYTSGRVDVPDVGGIFLDFADRQMKQHQIGLDNAMQQAKMEEDRRRYETELGFKQRQEQRVIDELNRAQATREGVLATLDPKAYQGAKIADMENQMRAGLANLSPQDRAEAEKQWAANFNKGATGEYVNRLATTNANVDPSALLSAQVSMQNKALNDPTSELYKAKQLEEWNQKKREYDYKHGLDLSKIRAQRDYEKSKENMNIGQASKLLGVSTIGNVVTGDNQSTIDNVKVANDKIAKKQEAYGNAYVQAYDSNPNAKPEELDALARKAVGITTGVGIEKSIGNVIPLANVPEYKKYTTEKQKTKEEYTRDLLNEAKSNNMLNANTLQLIDSLSKEYAAGLKDNKEVIADSRTLEDLKNVIKDLKGDPSKATTKEGAKQYINTLEAKMKNKPSGTYGIGPLSVDAANKTGIGKELIGSEWEDVKAVAERKNISDKDLAVIINTANQNHTWTPTMTSTQKKAILEMLSSYPNKQ